MKALFFIFSFWMFSFGIPAQDNPETSASSPSAEERVIVIDPDSYTQQKPRANVFVESGSDAIVGEPLESVRAAHRSWKSSCDFWKSELKSNNQKNLLIASCGTPQRRTEKVGLSTLYTFESKSTYKIRVGCE